MYNFLSFFIVFTINRTGKLSNGNCSSILSMHTIASRDIRQGQLSEEVICVPENDNDNDKANTAVSQLAYSALIGLIPIFAVA